MNVWKIGSRWSEDGQWDSSVLDIFWKHGVVFVGGNGASRFLNAKKEDLVAIADGFTIVGVGIGPDGDVVAYRQSFEISRLKESAAAFPEYQSFVDGLIPRFVDLLVPFQQFIYYHPKQCGSASIKKVLPSLVPECSYSGMEIGDGMTASNEYARVTFGDVSEEDRAGVRAALLKYCHLDTLAMIKIIQALFKVSGFEASSN